MTILTPRYVEQQVAQPNGAAGPHVLAAHEPTREGEQPTVITTGLLPDPNSSSGFRAGPVAMPVPLKIAMIGTAPSSRMLAPYNDPSWTIWACSPGNMNALPRVDIWFELHSNLLWPEHESYGRPYIEWLKQQKFPIYMQERWPTTEGTMVPLSSIVPNAVAFPKDEMVALFGDDFFTSSFTWMMALAIKMGATEIALYGIDMASRDEYIRQRPGFFFFRYLARQHGIKVSAPHESDIMQSPALYAYVDSTPFGRKIMARRQEVSGRVGGMVQQRDQLNNSITYLQGAMEDLDYFESIWSGVANDMGRLEYENAQLKHKVGQLETTVAQFQATPTWSMSGIIEASPPGGVVEPAKPKRHYRRRLRSEVQPQPEPQVDHPTESPA